MNHPDLRGVRHEQTLSRKNMMTRITITVEIEKDQMVGTKREKITNAIEAFLAKLPSECSAKVRKVNVGVLEELANAEGVLP